MTEVKLVAVEGELQGREFPIEGELTIGRAKNNSIILNDDTVSRNHACIKIRDNKYVLSDLKSNNGTMVNGSKITEVELKNNDAIKIGAATFQFKAGGLEDVTAENATGLPVVSVAVPAPRAGGGRRPLTSLMGKGAPLKKSQKKEKGKGKESQTVSPGRVEKNRQKIVIMVVVLVILTGACLTLIPRNTAPQKEQTGSSRKKTAQQNVSKRVRDAGELTNFNSVEELLKAAQDTFEVGNKLYEEREITPGNLYKSIKHLEKAVALTEKLTPKPSVYAQALESLKRSEEGLDNKFRDLKFKIEQAVRLKEWYGAMKDIEALLATFPDPGDERYKYGKERGHYVRRYINTE